MKKLTIPFFIVFGVVYLFLSLPLVLDKFLKKNYIEFNETKYSLSKIQEEAPSVYFNYKRSENENLERTFNAFYTSQIVKLELKKKGFKKESELFQYEPSNQEMLSIYEMYKDSLQGQPFENVKDEIKNFVIQQNRQKVIQELYQKYPSQTFIEELPEMKIEVAEKNNPFMGEENAKVTVIEFFDLECPYCLRSQEVSKQIREKYKGQIKWVVRDFPLSFHKNAMFAHKVLNCFKEDKQTFWSAFDRLFAISSDLKKENVIAIAKELGLNDEKIDSCSSDNAIQSEIEQDLEDGQKYGVNGTPAFFINGTMISGARSLEDFSKVIDKELKKV